MKVWYEDFAAKRDKAIALEKEVMSLESHIAYLITRLEDKDRHIRTLRAVLYELDRNFRQLDPKYSGPRTKVPRIPDMHYRVKEVLVETNVVEVNDEQED